MGPHLKKWAGWYVSLVLFVALIGTNAFQAYHVFDQAITITYQSENIRGLHSDRETLVRAIVHDFRSKGIEEVAELMPFSVRKTRGDFQTVGFNQIVFWFQDGRMVRLEDYATNQMHGLE